MAELLLLLLAESPTPDLLTSKSPSGTVRFVHKKNKKIMCIIGLLLFLLFDFCLCFGVCFFLCFLCFVLLCFVLFHFLPHSLAVNEQKSDYSNFMVTTGK